MFGRHGRHGGAIPGHRRTIDSAQYVFGYPDPTKIRWGGGALKAGSLFAIQIDLELICGLLTFSTWTAPELNIKTRGAPARSPPNTAYQNPEFSWTVTERAEPFYCLSLTTMSTLGKEWYSLSHIRLTARQSWFISI
jgi:hypothetical protein